MRKTVSIGYQEFDDVIKRNLFYVDKTDFIKEWWENKDLVTLLTRPRRFGKTLTMSMLESFFSIENRDSGLFEGLKIWQDETYRSLQGSYPVIFLSFANVKETSFQETRAKICRLIQLLYRKYEFLLESEALSEEEKQEYKEIHVHMSDYAASLSIQQLSYFLYKHYGRKAIILLDEYDTPMQEAYMNGYWEELSAFVRNLFHATFKGNSYLERALLTGITRISKESIFSDLNNLKVVTTTSEEYADCFGFTEPEVMDALEEYGLAEKKQQVKDWYDGFTFGNKKDIYNPWSILNFLDTGKLRAYWANTSSNYLAGRIIREGSKDIKQNFEALLQGNQIRVMIDEQILYSQLDVKASSIWSLLLASGYLKIESTQFVEQSGKMYYHLSLTNKEVKLMFENMIHDWFADYDSGYNDFIKALMLDDKRAMNLFMNRVALSTFSFFDSGNKASAENEPERFYHGFVLGLMVELADRYIITSNRENGFGRYDVLLEPREKSDDAIILEFKVRDPESEKSLEDTVKEGLCQIEEKKYAQALIEKGVEERRIRRYAFAFQGKTVLIG